MRWNELCWNGIDFLFVFPRYTNFDLKGIFFKAAVPSDYARQETQYKNIYASAEEAIKNVLHRLTE